MVPKRDVSPPRARTKPAVPVDVLSTSDSDCSCDSCGEYRVRKNELRGAMRRFAQQERDDSGDEAYANGWLTYRYGKYGLVDPSDKTSKISEFQAWLVEVKNVAWESLAGFEERVVWIEFVNRYNTATMPSKRYYDLALYSKRPLRLNGPSKGILLDDEEERRQITRIARQEQKEREIKKALEEIKDDKELAAAIQEQRELRTELSFKFKTGEIEKARELQQQLRKNNNQNSGLVPDPSDEEDE